MVKNIIFDLGGVFIDLNYQLTIDAFKNLWLNLGIKKGMFLKNETPIITSIMIGVFRVYLLIINF
jgi:hypothetical protein